MRYGILLAQKHLQLYQIIIGLSLDGGKNTSQLSVSVTSTIISTLCFALTYSSDFRWEFKSGFASWKPALITA